MSAGYADGLVAEARAAHGRGVLQSPTATGRATNKTCGDEIELDVDHDGVLVLAVAHRARGCAFTVASASLLAKTVPGRGLQHARDLIEDLRRAVTSGDPLPPELALLASVQIYPARARCALLPWEALSDALTRSPGA